MLRKLLFLSLLFQFSSCLAGAKLSKHLEIVYSGNLNGELEPCGCSETGDLGGLKRRATVIAELRKQNPELLLLSSGGILGGFPADNIIKQTFILKGFQKLSYDAIGLQWNDLNYGETFIQKNQLPWIASNYLLTPQNTHLKLTKNDIPLNIYALLDPNTAPSKALKNETAHNLNIKQLTLKVKKQRLKNNVNILLTDSSLATLAENLPLDQFKFNIIIVKSNFEKYIAPKLINNTLILQPGSRGMYLGQLKLVLDQQNNILTFNHKVIPMPNTLDDHSSMNEWYKQYTQAIKNNYLADSENRHKLESRIKSYATHNACLSCHSKSHSIWLKSSHANAFQSLVNVNKTFDPECLSCHTLGMQTTGGFISNSITPELANVQCESCHGKALHHVRTNAMPEIHKPESLKAICLKCHTHSNSPDFDFLTYWKKIAH